MTIALEPVAEFQPGFSNSMNINFNLINYEKHFKTFNGRNTIIINS